VAVLPEIGGALSYQRMLAFFCALVAITKVIWAVKLC